MNFSQKMRFDLYEKILFGEFFAKNALWKDRYLLPMLTHKRPAGFSQPHPFLQDG